MPQVIQRMILNVTGLAVGWHGKAAAEGIDFSLEQGKTLVIAGPNGAGKSTLLKVLARLNCPIAGEVLLGGKTIWQYSAKEFACKVAYLPQELELGQDLTVEELVALGRNPHQNWWSWHMSDADKQAVRKALEKTNAWQFRHKYLSSLSGGERQRARIALALAQEPQFMLLDEPTLNLDFRHQIELIDILKDLKSQGIGILTVLHDLNLMARLADQILLLGTSDEKPSRVISYGAPSVVLESTTLRNAYQVGVSIVTDPNSGQNIYVPTL
jgi:iron complex transport system ATP-binding protein